MGGYSSPFRRDRNRYGGGILTYVREDIPCKILHNHNLLEDIEGIFLELNFRKSKLLLLGTYHPPPPPPPPTQQDAYYFQSIGCALETFITKYDKYVLAGDFNAHEGEEKMGNFLELHGLKCIVHDKTCFKSVINPSCIDLFLTNSPNSYHLD